MTLLRTFGWAFGITVIALAAAGILGGVQVLLVVAILIVLEVSLSFDNAVVNATILQRMSPFWQRIFLTVGILIAVFGMRLVFPLVVVGLTAQLNPVDVVTLALRGGDAETPGTYGFRLTQAHPAIAAFGGMFLLMLFLDFIFEEREITWLSFLEKPLAVVGKVPGLSAVVALVALLITATLLSHEPEQVLIAGVLGIVTYLLVNGLSGLFEVESEEADEADGDAPGEGVGPSGVKHVVGRAAFFLFLYLEVLDASFSFDGVIGAFAITQDIFVIATGLGVGAFYVRSLTIFLVRQGTLSEYVYLEHGAHWAIGALAVILLVGIEHEVPEVVTGLVGVAFILAAFLTSVVRNRRADVVPTVGA